MKYGHFFFTIATASIFACSSSENTEEEASEFSNEWELQIVDSIQVDYLADIVEGTFNKGVGIIKNIEGNTLIKFDSTGNILIKKTYPQEGPGTVLWLETLIENQGEYYGTTSFRDIYHFDSSLNLKKSLEMPFIGEARGGAYNRKNIKFWNNKILLWYPGRDGISPYINHFYRDYPLLELYDLETQDSKPVVRIPPTSKFSTDKFHDRPYINFTIENDSLYLTLSNEPLVHVYTMGDSVSWIRSMDFSPSDFLLIPGQKKPVSYSQSMQLHEASINAIYSDPSHLTVYYHGGITSDTFKNFELKERENFHRYPEFKKTYLKVYQYDFGWSNEVLVSSKIGPILNIESLSKPFYALRNDDFIGKEQDYLTFYKLQLVQK
ncbi:hypothetical protein [Algoriphagus sp. Y33]|uniref:hypothetical protein n=1 Tax=Algoriphagus sp. Y33 TaxID=2772483 RepID=UPI001784C5E3|nr:hypothetical protein [Algoriphagus sp. Y33]